jgi:hypothetical protein
VSGLLAMASRVFITGDALCSYYRKYDPAKVPDPSTLADRKRGCAGFRFVQKDRSNIRPFVSFSEPVFICPDIKDRSLDVVLGLVQVHIAIIRIKCSASCDCRLFIRAKLVKYASMQDLTLRL